MNGSDIDDTVRHMWTTRPTRNKADRKVAGVAAAIGRRYRIDPILIRIAFVVVTVYGGVGILLYLLGWLLLRQEGDEVSSGEALIGHGRSSMSKPLSIVLVIALIPASSAIVSGGLASLFSLAVSGAGMYLLHRHRGAAPEPVTAGTYAPADLAMSTTSAAGVSTPATGLSASVTDTTLGPTTLTGQAAAPTGPAPTGPAPTGPAPTGPAPTGTTSTHPAPAGGTPGQYPPPQGDPATGVLDPPTVPGASMPPGGPTASGQTAGTPPHGAGQQPPAWDPLGVAPFAWDLPDLDPPEPPVTSKERRRRSAVTPITLALALIVGGTASIAALVTDEIGALEVSAMTLAVVGVGLVVGSLVRGGRGLIGVVIPLGLVTYGMTVVPADHYGFHGAGDRDWQVRTVAELATEYRHSAGDATLDLSQLELADGDRVQTAVKLGAGDLRVVLPPDADVELRCTAGAGDVTCLDKLGDGLRVDVRTENEGLDGPGGGTIVLDASLGTGDVKVTRG